MRINIYIPFKYLPDSVDLKQHLYDFTDDLLGHLSGHAFSLKLNSDNIFKVEVIADGILDYLTVTPEQYGHIYNMIKKYFYSVK